MTHKERWIRAVGNAFLERTRARPPDARSQIPDLELIDSAWVGLACDPGDVRLAVPPQEWEEGIDTVLMQYRALELQAAQLRETMRLGMS